MKSSRTRGAAVGSRKRSGRALQPAGSRADGHVRIGRADMPRAPGWYIHDVTQDTPTHLTGGVSVERRWDGRGWADQWREGPVLPPAMSDRGLAAFNAFTVGIAAVVIFGLGWALVHTFLTDAGQEAARERQFCEDLILSDRSVGFLERTSRAASEC